jgi:hypothetical protein
MIMATRCNEELPARVEPSDILSGNIQGEYLFNPFENVMLVTMTVRNDYEETLDGIALFNGKIKIAVARDTSLHKTFDINASNVTFLRVKRWNPLTRQLTLDPHDTIKIAVKWNWVTDDGRDLTRSYFQYSPHPDCKDYRLKADSVTFDLYGELKLFDKTNLLIVPGSRFLVCHVIGPYNVQGCPPVRADIPCFVLPKDTLM